MLERAPLRRSAVLRQAALFSLAFSLVVLLLGVSVYLVMRAELRLELHRRILEERDAVLAQARGGARGLARVVAGRSGPERRDMVYALVGPAGLGVAGMEIRGPLRTGWGRAVYRDAGDRMDDAVVGVWPVGGGRRLVIGADPESIERVDARMLPIFACAFGVIVAIGTCGGMMMAANLRRRLARIATTAEAIIAGEMDRRIEVGLGGDEFDRLSGTLNRMLDRMTVLLENLRQVSGDIAHDLRTPLARLRQELEAGSAADADLDLARGALGRASRHADDLLDLFAAVLSIAEVEAGPTSPRDLRFDLSALVADVAESFAPGAEDGGRQVERSVAPGLLADGRPELVARLLANLLDNALCHTPAGTRIAVRLAPARGGPRLVVADDGPGIPAEDRDRVFERFVRLDRSRSTPGHGLGLRMVSAVAAAHRATVRLEDNAPGARFVVDFPGAGR